MKNILVVVDNDYYNDARVPNEVKILSAHFQVFVLCFRFKLTHTKLFNGGDAVATNVTGGVDTISENVNVIQISINKKIKNILFGIQNTIPIYDYFLAFHIKKLIKKHNISFLHVHDLYMAYSGYLAKRKTNIPLILDLHENYVEAVKNYNWTKHPLKRLLAQPHKWGKKEKKLLSLADKIIVVHQTFRDLLLQKYCDILKPENMAIYPNVPDLERFTPLHEGGLRGELPPSVRGGRGGVTPLHERGELPFEKNDKFILLYFGIISERRGIITCIKAVNSLKQKYPQLHLLLIGPIDNADKSLFADYFKQDNVTHISWIDISLLPTYINIADICLAPFVKNNQHDTTIANKLFQYALLGKPQILSDCTPHIDFIAETNCGLIFKSEDNDDLAQKIEYLIHNPDKCQELGENGKISVREKFNTDVYKKELLGVYDN